VKNDEISQDRLGTDRREIAKECVFLQAEIPYKVKNGLFEPFIYKNDDFTKTGSGQT
jgi:hypothetical protein